MVPAAGLPLELIPPVPMPRRPGLDLVLVRARLVRAVARRRRRCCAGSRPTCVLGFGGYVSTPAYLAARRLGVPIVIHEQNVLPGLANRLAARLTRPRLHLLPATPRCRTRTCIGLPLRRGDHRARPGGAAAAAARAAFGLPADRPTLLVSGGSQGALSINRAVAGRRATGCWPAGIQVLHVLGPKNLTDDTVRRRPIRTTGAVYAPLAYVERDGAARTPPPT